MINLNDTHEQIAETLVQEFDEHLNNIRCGSNGMEDMLHELAVGCAILCVENMLKVCPAAPFELVKSYHGVPIIAQNPDYLKLTQTLNILKK